MNKLFQAALACVGGVALTALLVVSGALHSGADAGGAMHNCPQEGEWAISVWTGGDGASAEEALATCGNIEAAYTYDNGETLRWFPDAPEGVNNMGPFNEHDGVIALGGPTVPVVEPETNVSVYGTLGGCTDLAIATLSAGQGHAHARTGLHTRPPTFIEGSTATWTWTQMPVAKEVCLYCNGEFLQCADFPKASGDAHIYTVEVVVGMLTYEILPRQHEYMQFEWELQEDGTYRIGRLGYGGKVPFNKTCPNDAWMWDERDPRGFWCEGYPDAVFGAHECGPGQEPVPGKTYCVN